MGNHSGQGATPGSRHLSPLESGESREARPSTERSRANMIIQDLTLFPSATTRVSHAYDSRMAPLPLWALSRLCGRQGALGVGLVRARVGHGGMDVLDDARQRGARRDQAGTD